MVTVEADQLPDFAGDFDDALQLLPLLVFSQQVALLVVEAETALGA